MKDKIKTMQSTERIEPLESWAEGIKGRCNPLLIIGPCSAESESQIMRTAEELKKIDRVAIFRAGIWKPRTRPGFFEGAGEKGLVWLRNVKQKTGLLTATEVATEQQLESALEHGVDIVWIGARTTSNPFSVQSLANALGPLNIPVLIKNPIQPDINLWIGAIERFLEAGVKKIAAVHRGFFPFEKIDYRYSPNWELPIEIMRRFRNLPMICDPSHISGDKGFILEIAQKALNLNMDGLMIECHIDPSRALSDAKQQISVQQLGSLLQRIIIRQPHSDDPQFKDLLEHYRMQIDELDSKLLHILAQRLQIVEKIGFYKNHQNVTIFQPDRWNELFSSRIELGKKMGLPVEDTERLFQLIHEQAVKKQEEIFGESAAKEITPTDLSLSKRKK